MDRLMKYFLDGADAQSAGSIGMEVETSFVSDCGVPISRNCSQEIFTELTHRGWRVTATRGNLVTSLVNDHGDNLAYDLGRQNLEISGAVASAEAVVDDMRRALDDLYGAAATRGAFPWFQPVISPDGDMLIVPDERDATWVRLDGRASLNLLAITSSVQFTVEVGTDKALNLLNRLGEHINAFLADYPQEALWRRYIAESSANYDPCRYGGPLHFRNLEGYCRQLGRHAVVQADKLVPYNQVDDLDIPLFLRSIWWYFRFRRYGKRLCIEVRPLPRRTDDAFESQLKMVLEIMKTGHH